jgi:hypothetical protein
MVTRRHTQAAAGAVLGLGLIALAVLSRMGGRRIVGAITWDRTGGF